MITGMMIMMVIAITTLTVMGHTLSNGPVYSNLRLEVTNGLSLKLTVIMLIRR